MGCRFGFSPRPNSATRGATGDRVPLVRSREWALGSSGVRATAACRQRKEKEPSIGAACPLAVPFGSEPLLGTACPLAVPCSTGVSETWPMLIPLLALPAAAVSTAE